MGEDLFVCLFVLLQYETQPRCTFGIWCGVKSYLNVKLLLVSIQIIPPGYELSLLSDETFLETKVVSNINALLDTEIHNKTTSPPFL